MKGDIIFNVLIEKISLILEHGKERVEALSEGLVCLTSPSEWMANDVIRERMPQYQDPREYRVTVLSTGQNSETDFFYFSKYDSGKGFSSF
jgi:hypothetical protein